VSTQAIPADLRERVIAEAHHDAAVYLDTHSGAPYLERNDKEECWAPYAWRLSAVSAAAERAFLHSECRALYIEELERESARLAGGAK
jgi:hypothetical protein